MWAIRQTLIVAAVLAVQGSARADPLEHTMVLASMPKDFPPILHSPALHAELLPHQTSAPADSQHGSEPFVPSRAPAISSSGIQGSNNGSIAVNSGLQFVVTDGQRPSLQFRFSESGVMRFRAGRAGASVVLKWEF